MDIPVILIRTEAEPQRHGSRLKAGMTTRMESLAGCHARYRDLPGFGHTTDDPMTSGPAKYSR
ncbi:hypothetical protein GCM10011335_40350 [Aureimonas glaciei]|uniref:Uncharacterized protein n=1 Tax=Aureimonas glaciei TaxID=1776957 RepID=A0A916Y755_9HYPH|nr:hypothetical protein GCM10011335_40350 [Aureimonas glaciei]